MDSTKELASESVRGILDSDGGNNIDCSVFHTASLGMKETGEHHMKTMMAVLVMTIAATAVAQQTNTLDTLRQAYDKKEQSTLVQYGKALNTTMVSLKKKGDLDNVLILQAEIKRFEAEKTVQNPKDTQDTVRPASEAYHRAMVAVLGQYVASLDGLIKKEVAADRIEEAKVVKAEKDKAAFILADMEMKLPVKVPVGEPSQAGSTTGAAGQRLGAIALAKKVAGEVVEWNPDTLEITLR